MGERETAWPWQRQEDALAGYLSRVAAGSNCRARFLLGSAFTFQRQGGGESIVLSSCQEGLRSRCPEMARRRRAHWPLSPPGGMRARGEKKTHKGGGTSLAWWSRLDILSLGNNSRGTSLFLCCPEQESCGTLKIPQIGFLRRLLWG